MIGDSIKLQCISYIKAFKYFHVLHVNIFKWNLFSKILATTRLNAIEDLSYVVEEEEEKKTMLIPKMSMTLKAKYSHKHQSKCRKILLVWKGLAEKNYNSC